MRQQVLQKLFAAPSLEPNLLPIDPRECDQSIRWSDDQISRWANEGGAEQGPCFGGRAGMPVPAEAMPAMTLAAPATIAALLDWRDTRPARRGSAAGPERALHWGLPQPPRPKAATVADRVSSQVRPGYPSGLIS